MSVENKLNVQERTDYFVVRGCLDTVLVALAKDFIDNYKFSLRIVSDLGYEVAKSFKEYVEEYAEKNEENIKVKLGKRFLFFGTYHLSLRKK